MTKPDKIKPRLGRGLRSLVSVSEFDGAEAPATGLEMPGLPPVANATSDAPVPVIESTRVGRLEFLEVPVGEIQVNPHQPRRVFNEASLKELAASLKANGLIQPVSVRKLEEGGYQLIAGERRWRAAKLAGLERVPALVREVDSLTQAQMALVENIQREDLNAIDRALGYKLLIDQLGLTQNELAGRLGEDRTTVAHFLRLLDLSEPVRQLVAEGKLGIGHAKLIAGVMDPAQQKRLAELAINQSLTVRNLERIIEQGGQSPDEAAAAEKPDAHLLDLERSMSSQLGMRVQVRGVPGTGRGRVVLHFSSLDQFDDLIVRMGIKTE